MFIDNFEKFKNVSQDIKNAGPKISWIYSMNFWF
jgi:hypothetical protein